MGQQNCTKKTKERLFFQVFVTSFSSAKTETNQQRQKSKIAKVF